MKKSLLTLCIFSVTLASQAQLAPNGDFEQPIAGGALPGWDALGGSINQLTSLNVNTQSGQQTLVSASGPNFIGMINNSNVAALRTKKYPLSTRPASLRFLTCYLPANANERYLVSILFTKKNTSTSAIDTILLGTLTSGTGTVYPWASVAVDLAPIYRPGSEMPDSAIILFASSSNASAAPNTALLLDDVKFSDHTAGVKGIGVETAFSKTVNVYPNPAAKAENTVIEYELNSNADVNVDLIDIQGRVVKNIFSGNQAYGSYSHTMSTEGLAPGIYFCKVKANDNVATQRIIVTE